MHIIYTTLQDREIGSVSVQRLHMKHPKGAAVMHTHQSWTAAICALEDPSLLMIHQNCLRFYQVNRLGSLQQHRVR